MFNTSGCFSVALNLYGDRILILCKVAESFSYKGGGGRRITSPDAADHSYQEYGAAYEVLLRQCASQHDRLLLFGFHPTMILAMFGEAVTLPARNRCGVSQHATKPVSMRRTKKRPRL